MTKSSVDSSRTCFVISPIGEENSEIRRRADQILKHVISPAAKECGYEAVRADQINEAGTITSQVIQHIIEDSMVVADLTGRNPNVFYELAIRHSIRKPVVQIIQHNETIPFDVAATRTIKVDHHDLDSVANAREALVKQIKAAQIDPGAVDSPITVALNVQSLRQSDNPLASSAAELISGMNELKSLVAGTLDVVISEVRRPREADIMHMDEVMHTAHLIRALTAAGGDKETATGMSAETATQLRTLVARLEHLVMRNEERLFRRRRTTAPGPQSTKITEEIKKND